MMDSMLRSSNPSSHPTRTDSILAIRQKRQQQHGGSGSSSGSGWNRRGSNSDGVGGGSYYQQQHQQQHSIDENTNSSMSSIGETISNSPLNHVRERSQISSRPDDMGVLDAAGGGSGGAARSQTSSRSSSRDESMPRSRAGSRDDSVMGHHQFQHYLQQQQYQPLDAGYEALSQPRSRGGSKDEGVPRLRGGSRDEGASRSRGSSRDGVQVQHPFNHSQQHLQHHYHQPLQIDAGSSANSVSSSGLISVDEEFEEIPPPPSHPSADSLALQDSSNFGASSTSSSSPFINPSDNPTTVTTTTTTTTTSSKLVINIKSGIKKRRELPPPPTDPDFEDAIDDIICLVELEQNPQAQDDATTTLMRGYIRELLARWGRWTQRGRAPHLCFEAAAIGGMRFLEESGGGGGAATTASGGAGGGSRAAVVVVHDASIMSLVESIEYALANALAGITVDELEPGAAAPMRDKAVALLSDEFLARSACSPKMATGARRRTRYRRQSRYHFGSGKISGGNGGEEVEEGDYIKGVSGERAITGASRNKNSAADARGFGDGGGDIRGSAGITGYGVAAIPTRSSRSRQQPQQLQYYQQKSNQQASYMYSYQQQQQQHHRGHGQNQSQNQSQIHAYKNPPVISTQLPLQHQQPQRQRRTPAQAMADSRRQLSSSSPTVSSSSSSGGSNLFSQPLALTAFPESQQMQQTHQQQQLQPSAILSVVTQSPMVDYDALDYRRPSLSSVTSSGSAHRSPRIGYDNISGIGSGNSGGNGAGVFAGQMDSDGPPSGMTYGTHTSGGVTAGEERSSNASRVRRNTSDFIYTERMDGDGPPSNVKYEIQPNGAMGSSFIRHKRINSDSSVGDVAVGVNNWQQAQQHITNKNSNKSHYNQPYQQHNYHQQKHQQNHQSQQHYQHNHHHPSSSQPQQLQQNYGDRHRRGDNIDDEYYHDWIPSTSSLPSVPASAAAAAVAAAAAAASSASGTNVDSMGAGDTAAVGATTPLSSYLSSMLDEVDDLLNNPK